jgi:putative membrane protein insertion efficiency factor
MSTGLILDQTEAHQHKEDATYKEPRLRDIHLSLKTIARIPLLSLIRAYQMTISRVLPANTCRFYPSCSHYGYRSIYKYGFFKGSLMAIWRVLRCNPFNIGGYDPVP